MIEAIKDKIILEKLTRINRDSSIILPDTAVDPQAYGRVISAGPDATGIKKGDILTYHIHAAGRGAIYLKKRHLEIVQFNEIYGKLVDEDIISELVIFGSEETKSNIQVVSEGGGKIVVP